MFRLAQLSRRARYFSLHPMRNSSTMVFSFPMILRVLLLYIPVTAVVAAGACTGVQPVSLLLPPSSLLLRLLRMFFVCLLVAVFRVVRR